VLDAHPEIACPPETDLASVFASAEFHFRATLDDRDGPEAGDERLATILVDIADRVNGEYARRRGASRWADKSLSSARHAALLQKIFPDGQFVCLFRECRDTVASLLEASPFGFQHFGLDGYVRNNPGNTLFAAALLWADTVEAILAFEEQHAGQCHRVRYEDLVHAPGEYVRPLLEFLGLPGEEHHLKNDVVFAPDDSSSGFGDYKINFTRNIHADSVGRGATLPIGLIPPPLEKRINLLQSRLNYPRLRTLPKADVARGDARRMELPSGVVAKIDGRWSANGHQHQDRGPGKVEALLRERLSTRAKSAGPNQEEFGEMIRVILVDAPEQPLFVDVVANRLRLSGSARLTIIAHSSTLLSLASLEINPAVAARSSLVRILFPKEITAREYPANAYRAFLGVLCASQTTVRGTSVPLLASSPHAS
jgi:hypothetical protein